jgi:hypothetical protein
MKGKWFICAFCTIFTVAGVILPRNGSAGLLPPGTPIDILGNPIALKSGTVDVMEEFDKKGKELPNSIAGIRNAFVAPGDVVLTEGQLAKEDQGDRSKWSDVVQFNNIPVGNPPKLTGVVALNTDVDEKAGLGGNFPFFFPLLPGNQVFMSEKVDADLKKEPDKDGPDGDFTEYKVKSGVIDGKQQFITYRIFSDPVPGVPEPASMALLGIGVLVTVGYCWWCRRRTRRPQEAAA